MGYIALCALVFALSYLVNILYVTVFYHRGLTHKAVQLHPKVEKFVFATGNWVTGLDPKGWATMHRLHHQHSDTALDPHSPRNHGIIMLALAQLKSYERVLVGLARKEEPYTRIASDIDARVHWLNRKKLWWLPYALHAAIGAALGFAFDAWLLGACYYFGMVSHPVQGWMVNAFGHHSGYRNFKTSDDSRNNTLVAWLVAGEGFQNNHHRHPTSAKFSMRWWEMDWGYTMCLVLQAMGALKILHVAGNARDGREAQEEAQALPLNVITTSVGNSTGN